MELTIPALMSVDQKLRHGTVRQMLREATRLYGRCVKFTAAEGTFLRFSPDGGGDDLLLLRAAPAGLSLPEGVPALLKSNLPADATDSVDASNALWHAHPLLTATEKLSAQDRPQATRETWKGAFHYVDEGVVPEAITLRPPQTGALHAIHAHWSVEDGVATIVMPTGTGKTETMLATAISAQCERVLVVVPTDALRTQVAEKFLTLGILKMAKSVILDSSAIRPVVGVLTATPKDISEVDALFAASNVVVTTSHLAALCQGAVRERIAALCSHLFIDEAHHVEAPTWKEFKEVFRSKRVLQFTATPFREDDKRVDGKLIYVYPLRKAQKEGYFRPIRFSPVNEFGATKSDRAIAAKVLEELKADVTGKHRAMARVATTDRAAEVFAIYKALGEFNPVMLHSKVKSAERELAEAQLRSGQSRIVVCVDMLGEGFDMPELKIAAFHDLRKSLAVTLQLAGRFTRSREDLGDPVFIANVAGNDLREELERLYTQDTDWNELLPDLSESAIRDELNAQEFVAGFQGNLGGVPIKELSPSASTVVYRTNCANWAPRSFRSGIRGIGRYEQVEWSLNEKDNTLVFITAARQPVAWTEVAVVQDFTWELFIAFWDRDRHLLFIHGSSNSSEFKELAKALCGPGVTLITDPVVYRVFNGINRLVLTNVGLGEQFGRQIRYTGRMGADVGSRLSASSKQGARRAVLAGMGYERGSAVTIGAAKGGRVWSIQRLRVDTFAAWCRNIATKLSDDTIDPDAVLKGTLIPKQVDARPASVPIGADWPIEILEAPEAMTTVIWSHGAESRLTEVGIEVLHFNATDPLVLRIFGPEHEALVRLELFRVNEESTDFKFVYESTTKVTIRRGREHDLCDYLTEHAPTIWFADGSSLDGNLHIELVHAVPPYPLERLQVKDWSGIDITKESQRDQKRADSIQFSVIDQLKKKGGYEVIFDDDDAGEAADVVTLKLDDPANPRRIDVEFYHCKFSSAAQPGARVDDLYVVCGQSQRSVTWLHSKDRRKDLFTHLLLRNSKRVDGNRPSRLEVGKDSDLIRFQSLSKRLPLRISVIAVQPGVSKAAVSDQQLTLLSVVERYLQETYMLDFELWCSA